MDFLRNRAFRQSLLVHREVTLNRNVEWTTLQDLEIGCRAQAVDARVDERSDARAEFRMPNGMTIATGAPITKAALAVLAAQAPQTLPFNQLFAAAHARVGNALSAQADMQTLGVELLHIAGVGLLELRMRAAQFTDKVGARPVAWPVAREGARHGVHVTNLRHETVTLDEFNRQLVMRLDGTRDLAALVEELAALVASNALAIEQGGVEVRDAATVRTVIAKAVAENLPSLARAALLVA
jgi:methyltransferase-like protein